MPLNTDHAQELTRERPTAEMFPLLYTELRNLARARMAGEQGAQTLQATALVHEAYLRLSGREEKWKSRSYFFAAAAEAMRRILIDRARAKQAAKRGSGRPPEELDGLELVSPVPDESLLALDAALEKLRERDPEKAELVKLKFFAGLTSEEAGQALGLSEATAKRHWAFARAWLAREMGRP